MREKERWRKGWRGGGGGGGGGRFGFDNISPPCPRLLALEHK